MPADPLASLSALEVWLGAPLCGPDVARAEAVLGAVSSLIRSVAGVTWETDPVPDDVHTVTLEVAARVYRNPSAAAQVSNTTGPFTESKSYSTTPGLYLTAAEKAIVGRYRPTTHGLWSMPTRRDDPVVDTYWVPVSGSDNPFPWYAEDIGELG
jgi:hypothetical protein